VAAAATSSNEIAARPTTLDSRYQFPANAEFLTSDDSDTLGKSLARKSAAISRLRLLHGSHLATKKSASIGLLNSQGRHLVDRGRRRLVIRKIDALKTSTIPSSGRTQATRAYGKVSAISINASIMCTGSEGSAARRAGVRQPTYPGAGNRSPRSRSTMALHGMIHPLLEVFFPFAVDLYQGESTRGGRQLYYERRKR